MVCLTCGWVTCSDDSPNQHARAHYEETDHPVAAGHRALVRLTYFEGQDKDAGPALAEQHWATKRQRVSPYYAERHPWCSSRKGRNRFR